MDDTPLDFDAYQRRIGFVGPVFPTLETLARLIALHAAAIPFENIDVLAGRVPALDGASLQRKLVQRRRGGYCFEQNNLFLACLEHAGFRVRRLEARVRVGVPSDLVTGRTHMSLRVTVDGDDYLADVGFGGLAPMGPLKLDSPAEQEAAGEVYRFVDTPGGRLLQARTHEGWSDCYCVAASEPQHVDYEIGNWFVATHPKAMLRHNLLVARAIEGGRMTLFNKRLSLRTAATGKTEERSLDTRSELSDVLADGFGLEVEDVDLDAVMTVLARQAEASLSGDAARTASEI